MTKYKMMRYLYYPGCSQKSSAISYERSFLAVCDALGIELTELEDWNCCGTTIAISVNKMVSSFLGARNLGLANPHKIPLVTPCPSCYVSMKRILKECKENKNQFDRINELLAEEHLELSTEVELYHSLEFLVSVIGLDAITAKIQNSLKGLRIAPYYGCQLAGPYAIQSRNHDPQDLEKLVEVLGAAPVNFPFRTLCCGGSLMFTLKSQAEKLSSMILRSIRRTDADMIVTPCGLCQLNLEVAMKKIWKRSSNHRFLPIINIGQLVGLALDLDPRKIYMNKKKILAKRSIKSTTN